MATHRYTLIAREGKLLIFLAACVATTVYVFIGAGVALPFILVTLFLFFLFRDPPRKIPAVPLGLVSPADGTVIVSEEAHDDFLNRQAIRLIIKMNWYGIYSIRSPMEGKVMQRWLGNDTKGSTETAGTIPGISAGKSAQWIQSDEGDDIIVCMTNDKITRRPGCLVHSGERIGQGQRCGFVHFGAIIELFIPLNCRLDVKKMDKVRAGSDIIATLVHK